MLEVYEFDPAGYLRDEAAVAAYVKAARDSGDAQQIEAAEAAAVRARLRLAQEAAKAT